MPETAKDKLKKMTAWDTAPALAEAELDELLVQTSTVDADGFSPADDEWVPTYDINAAAAATEANNGSVTHNTRSAHCQALPDSPRIASCVS